MFLSMCVFVCMCAEGPAEPAERRHHVPEGELARGAAALQAAVGRPGDGGDQAAQPDPSAPAGPRRLLHEEPGAPGQSAAKITIDCSLVDYSSTSIKHRKLQMLQFVALGEA